MSSIRDFRELEVFLLAEEGADRIFELSKRWPESELYSMTSQIRKCARSVCSNIAEAWRKRLWYPASFLSKLSDADGEAGETAVWLRQARRCNYLPEQEFQELGVLYDRVCGKLVRMMQHPERWCPKARIEWDRRRLMPP
jgi:four helix bundle protein